MVAPKGAMKGLAPYSRRVAVSADGSWSPPLPAGRFTAWPVATAVVEKAADNARTYDHGLTTPTSLADAIAFVRGRVTRFVILKTGLIPTVLGQEKPITEPVGTEVLFVHVTVRSPSA